MEATPRPIRAQAAQQLLTHSRLSCFRACPRRHYIRYELGLRPLTDDVPRRVGSAFHAALEAFDKGIDPDAATAALEDPYEVALVTAMFVGHVNRWADDALEPVASELEFELPLVNPDTGKPTPIWRVAGKIDRIVKLTDGRLALMEYKTTSRDFAPGAEYWLRLHLDQQLSIYLLAARELGYDCQTILYDVTRRPSLRPYRATPEDVRRYTKDGKLYASQRDRDEDVEEFGQRVMVYITERPDHYFARIEIARLEQDLEECSREIWQQQMALREAQRSNRWYRNPGACFTPTACDYISICPNRDLEAFTPSGFSRDEYVHPELSGNTVAEG